MLEQYNTVANCLEDSTREGLFKCLIDVLDKELMIFRELRDFLIAEKRMLMKLASLGKINENNTAKETIILKSRILEEARINILKKIARNLNIDDSETKLMSLANYAISEQKMIIEKQKNDLLKIARDINKMNDENKHILDASIINIKGSLDFISSLIDQSGVYLVNGKINEIRKNGRLLRTEG
jgi:hypothetical protein